MRPTTGKWLAVGPAGTNVGRGDPNPPQYDNGAGKCRRCARLVPHTYGRGLCARCYLHHGGV